MERSTNLKNYLRNASVTSSKGIPCHPVKGFPISMDSKIFVQLPTCTIILIIVTYVINYQA